MRDNLITETRSNNLTELEAVKYPRCKTLDDVLELINTFNLKIRIEDDVIELSDNNYVDCYYGEVYFNDKLYGSTGDNIYICQNKLKEDLIQIVENVKYDIDYEYNLSSMTWNDVMRKQKFLRDLFN